MIGIDISDRSVKVVEVTDDPLPELKTVCWSPLSPQLIEQGLVQDVSLLTEEVRAALTKCSPQQVTGSLVVASIPESRSFMRVLEVPTITEQEMTEAVQWAVRGHIPFDLDRIYLDWELVPGQSTAGGMRHVVVGAAQRDVVDPLLAVLDGLGLQVVALELESQAVVRCLLPRDSDELREIQGVLMVDIGATLTDVVLFDHGAIRFTANIQWGGDDLTQLLVHRLGVSPEEALLLKSAEAAAPGGRDQRVNAVIQEGVLDLVQNVVRVVDEIAAELPVDQRMRAILLSGGSANVVGIADYFASIFSHTPIQLGNPLTNLAMPQRRGLTMSRADAMHFTTAVGLALRPVERLL